MRDAPIAARTAAAGLLLAGTALLGACTSTPAAPVNTPPPVTTAAPPATTAAVQAPPAAPVTAGYDTAKTQWQMGATAISAQQGLYWTQAATALTVGEATDTNTTGYADAITHLKELVTLPDAQQTPAQNAAYHADINALNAFFKTPGLYS
jgi:hypothetical protein